MMGAVYVSAAQVQDAAAAAIESAVSTSKVGLYLASARLRPSALPLTHHDPDMFSSLSLSLCFLSFVAAGVTLFWLPGLLCSASAETIRKCSRLQLPRLKKSLIFISPLIQNCFFEFTGKLHPPTTPHTFIVDRWVVCVAVAVAAAAVLSWSMDRKRGLDFNGGLCSEGCYVPICLHTLTVPEKLSALSHRIFFPMKSPPCQTDTCSAS